MRGAGLALGLAALAGFAAGCGGAKVKPGSAAAPAARLEISVSPPAPARLLSGTVVTVSVQAVPATELAWVSGTVKVLGAKPRGLRPSKDGKTWTLKSQVPPMVTVPPGSYELKAWGRTLSGEPLETSLQYEVK